MRCFTLIPCFLCATMVQADVVVATQIIRANSIIPANAIAVKDGTIPGTHTNLADVIGLEARTSIYPGRPVRLNDTGAPALVERNQIVALTFVTQGLEISTEGRSLSRAGVGDRVRVMNLTSRTTISGTVLSDGSIQVSN
ncbi:flagellar basal body P-ring formation chaperone FlgA [Shimia sp.]|uniref:flagellar basal body P-ring formation chaperone FlgA n=1 Tax=Shimia sp. TaxID=1954381 RepID=UPI003296F78E